MPSEPQGRHSNSNLPSVVWLWQLRACSENHEEQPIKHYSPISGIHVAVEGMLWEPWGNQSNITHPSVVWLWQLGACSENHVATNQTLLTHQWYDSGSWGHALRTMRQPIKHYSPISGMTVAVGGMLSSRTRRKTIILRSNVVVKDTLSEESIQKDITPSTSSRRQGITKLNT